MRTSDKRERQRKLLEEFELTIRWDLLASQDEAGASDADAQKAREMRRYEILRQLAFWE